MNAILWLSGYRKIGAGKEEAAKLLDICREAEISYSGFSVDGTGAVSFFCSRRSAKKILHRAQEEKIPLSSSPLCGLPAELYKRRNRWGLILGAIAALILIAVSDDFVWDIRVTGNETVTAGEVREELRACGFGVGSYLPGFSAREIENRVLLKSDRLGWISIRMDGTVAEVQVVERVEEKSPEPLKPANLIASEDGQIEEVRLFRGDCVVKIGQAVKKGDLLVSGLYDSDTVGCRFTRASGSVLARTEKVISVEVPLAVTEKTYETGKIAEIDLNFFQFSLKIYKNGGKETGSCAIIEKENTLAGMGLDRLPVSVTERIRREERETEIIRTPEEAEAEAYRLLGERLRGLSPEITLLSKEIVTKTDETACRLTCTLQCVEDIARQAEFEVVGNPDG